MKEAYVSFKTAKLLKEKGFAWRVFNFYDEHGGFSEHIGSVYSLYNWNYPTKDEYGSQYCSAPTQQMACSWLREEHKIHITTEPLEMFKEERIVYEPTIYLLNDFDDFALEYETVHLKECDTNEDAIEAALQYVLTKLI